MAIEYAGGFIINATGTSATLTDMADWIKSHLVQAGWSVASGSSGDWLVQTATTPAPASMNVRMRIWDPGGANNCTRLALNSTDGLVVLDTDRPMYVLPDGSTYRIIANKYQFFLMKDLDSSEARRFVAGGVPFVPDFLTADLTDTAWLICDSQSDTDLSKDASFRTGMETISGNRQMIVNGNGVGDAGTTGQNYRPELVVMHGAISTSTHPFKWFNADWAVYEPIIQYNYTDVGLAQGPLWDSFISTQDDMPLDTEFAFDSRTFHAITAPNTEGVLCVAVTSTSP